MRNFSFSSTSTNAFEISSDGGGNVDTLIDNFNNVISQKSTSPSTPKDNTTNFIETSENIVESSEGSYSRGGSTASFDTTTTVGSNFSLAFEGSTGNESFDPSSITEPSLGGGTVSFDPFTNAGPNLSLAFDESTAAPVEKRTIPSAIISSPIGSLSPKGNAIGLFGKPIEREISFSEPKIETKTWSSVSIEEVQVEEVQEKIETEVVVEKISPKVKRENFTDHGPLSYKIKVVLERYKTELIDKNSKEFQLFDFLSRQNYAEGYDLLEFFFLNLYFELFNLEDVFLYLDNEQLGITFNSLFSFLRKEKKQRMNIIKNRLYKDSFLKYGNLFNFINNLYISSSEIFFNEEEDSDFLKDASNFLLNSEINYLDVSNNNFKNLREEQNKYWELLEDYQAETYTNRNCEKIKDVLTKKQYNETNGFPVLLKTKFLKDRFFANFELNKFFEMTLRSAHGKIGKKEIDSFIEKMCYDIVNFNTEERPEFDYSIEGRELPDIYIFLTRKIPNILTNYLLRDLTTEQIKEIQFYLLIMLEFTPEYKTDYSSVYQTFSNLSIDIFDEIQKLKTDITAIRNILIETGKFI